MAYPNVEWWSALQAGKTVTFREDRVFKLSTVACGTLTLPSGRLVACDPFTFLRKTGNAFVAVPPGRYPVVITLAERKRYQQEPDTLESYLSLLIDGAAEEVTRRIITPAVGEPDPPPEAATHEDVQGFPVDAGAACFTDADSIGRLMPDDRHGWFDSLFKPGKPGNWFDQMQDPSNVKEGTANILLPGASDGENIVVTRTGMGDGAYPVVGGYDASGRLVRVHIDFMVIFDYGAE